MKLIKVTYNKITSESEEQGEYSGTGWIDSEGISMDPDEYDLEDGITAVDKAVDCLKENGCYMASGYPFYKGCWYSCEYFYEDITKDEQTQYNYHLEGFSEEEERAIYRRVITY